jgi:hypothetical protein
MNATINVKIDIAFEFLVGPNSSIGLMLSK